MVVILLIHESVLFTWISDPHDVVKAHTGEDYGMYCMRVLLHDGEQTSESVCKDTKCIFHNSSGPREAVVEDPLVIGKTPSGEGLHEPGCHAKCIVCNDIVRHRSVITGKGDCWWDAAMAFFSSHWFQI